MYNFFIDEANINNDIAVISGSDYNHIKNVLRMKIGSQILVSVQGYSHLSAIKSFEDNSVICEIIERDYKDANLPISVQLFQGLPKSDKMELIIQKAVELGADKIIPVAMKRCIVKLDDKKQDGKISRWQAISESASKQSKRNAIPEVTNVISFKNAVETLKTLDLIIVPYENKEGMQPTLSALTEIKSGYKVGVVIGPEGGFAQKEIDLLDCINAKTVSLGKRIPCEKQS